jgi:hypothetical protein
VLLTPPSERDRGIDVAVLISHLLPAMLSGQIRARQACR